MKRFADFLLAALFIFFGTAISGAQEQAPPPKPGPEHEKLAFFIGRWVVEGDIKASAFGPAGKFTFTESCDWLSGKFALLCKSDGTMLGGEFHGTEIMSYDMYENGYISYETNNWGENVFYHGSVDGDTWTWNYEAKINGKPVRTRFTLKRVSMDSATYTFDMALGTDPFATIMEGKQARQK